MSGVAANSLVVFAPVRADAGADADAGASASAAGGLSAALAELGAAPESPFARVPGTHFGRFALVPALTGPDETRYDELGPFLLMCADFDPPREAWVTALCAQATPALSDTIGCWEGFPGTADPAAVTAFFARHDVAPGFTVAGHRAATVEQIREALRLKRELRALAVRAHAERLHPTALRDAWDAAAAP